MKFTTTNLHFSRIPDHFRCIWGHAHTWPPKVHGPKIPKPPRNCIFAKFGSLRALKNASKSIDLVSKKSHVAKKTSLTYSFHVSDLLTTTLGPFWDPNRVPEANILTFFLKAMKPSSRYIFLMDFHQKHKNQKHEKAAPDL